MALVEFTTKDATTIRDDILRVLKNGLVRRGVPSPNVGPGSDFFVLASALEIFSIISPLFLQLTVDKVLAAVDRDLLVTLGIGFMLLIGLQSFLSALRS